MSLRIAIAGLALVAAFAAPASAQDEIFTDIRDAVPLRFFHAGDTAADPGNPNTLVIAFETGANNFRASAEVNNLAGTRVAMDTLSFVVTAPAGQYVASISCHLSGRGAVNTPGDARAAVNWVVNGQPAAVGSVGGGTQFPNTGGSWSLNQTATFTDPTLTSVPVSLTAELFAFAIPNLASAEVDLTSATIVVTFAATTPQN